MERAILEEAEHPEHAAIGAEPATTETLLDGPAWEQATSSTRRGGRAARSAACASRASVGASATADGARAHRAGAGATRTARRSAVVLTLRIDPCSEDRRG